LLQKSLVPSFQISFQAEVLNLGPPPFWKKVALTIPLQSIIQAMILTVQLVKMICGLPVFLSLKHKIDLTT
jgi:hypothetical protein